VANAIHELGPRRDEQLVDLNCAGLAGNLLESELFGHEKGAFTDAKKTKRGLFEIAHRGTLFLDEVGDMALEVQAKLLKVIEERRFRRLGGTVNVDVDVRLMAATHVDLEKAVKAGSFRSDLFYRLSVMPLVLPPLRKRRGEITSLCALFLREFAVKFGKADLRCTRETESMLQAYRWPGRVRELRNVLERAVLLCAGDSLEPRHLPENLRVQARTRQFVEGVDYSLESMEAAHIRQILTLCENNRSRAAKLLGIHRTTLLSKISKYNIDT
jgi:transcriptional regulator with PAS, ATPase and Fis domain